MPTDGPPTGSERSGYEPTPRSNTPLYRLAQDVRSFFSAGNDTVSRLAERPASGHEQPIPLPPRLHLRAPASLTEIEKQIAEELRTNDAEAQALAREFAPGSPTSVTVKRLHTDPGHANAEDPLDAFQDTILILFRTTQNKSRGITTTLQKLQMPFVGLDGALPENNEVRSASRADANMHPRHH